MDGWKIARSRARKARRPPRIYASLNRRGEIAMNAEAFKAIGRPPNVTLLYDAGTQRIGVKYPVALDRHFFPVRRHGRGRKTLVVRAARMLKQFGIEIERTHVFCDVKCVRFDGSPMLLLPLDEADPVAR